MAATPDLISFIAAASIMENINITTAEYLGKRFRCQD